MSELHQRARAAGLLVDWEDAAGTRRRVSDDSLAAILDALGDPDEDWESPLVTAELGEPLRLPSGRVRRFDQPGYFDEEGLVVAVAPERAWTVADAAPGRRIWGSAVQVPSLRDSRGEPFGDFTALARFAARLGEAGADALAISPVHALFPNDAARFGPYGPSSRLFRNVWLADPGDGDAPGGDGELIDWQTAVPDRMARLRRAFETRSDKVRDMVEAFRAEQGEALERHALFDALAAHFGGGWSDWPSACRDPGSAAVAAFAREHREEVEFYAYLQWLADRGQAEAQAAAKDAGMTIGLIADMAVGMDPNGSHAWSRPGALLSGLSIGAPPDPLGPDGQDWGVTGFAPAALRREGYLDFLDTIRVCMRHAGGVRIDHSMGLRRLWVVPHGARPTEGAYLAYPERDLMRLLALESWLAKAIVVGEDLGTVPDGFRDRMARRGFLGMRILWFERTRGGGFKAAAAWDPRAAAMTTTHDLPTVAGWWSERDVDWTWRIGRTSPHASEAEERRARAGDRRRLWSAIGSGAMPARDTPARAVTAAVAHVAATPATLAIVPAEDLLGETEQPNLPGTTDEHPNWRRRLSVQVEAVFDAPEFVERRVVLASARPR